MKYKIHHGTDPIGFYCKLYKSVFGFIFIPIAIITTTGGILKINKHISTWVDQYNIPSKRVILKNI